MAVISIWRRKPEYPKKTTDLPQVTDKRYCITDDNVISSTPHNERELNKIFCTIAFETPNNKYLIILVYQYSMPKCIYHIMLYRVHIASSKFELTTLVVIGTDCIDKL